MAEPKVLEQPQWGETHNESATVTTHKILGGSLSSRDKIRFGATSGAKDVPASFLNAMNREAAGHQAMRTSA